MPLMAQPPGIANAHDGEKCPFCPLDKEKKDLTSYIGKHNKSSTLGRRLSAAGDKKEDHLYVDSEHGKYSAEAHHLICGNEVLKEEGTLEKYLIVQSKTTSKGAAGVIDSDLNDVGYDVNSAKNGIWLPSVPYAHMGGRGRPAPERWWGDQTTWNRENPEKPARISLEEWEKTPMAFAVMQAVGLQFHKGEHGAVGQPHENYVKEAIKRLREISLLAENYSKVCPMNEDGSARTEPPFYPPYRLISALNTLSAGLAEELKGPPDSWNYYISEFALECAYVWKVAARGGA